MDRTLKYLRQEFPEIHYSIGKTFCWSPKTHEVFYVESSRQTAIWSLLHETSHALLEHTSYRSDIELVRIEVLAWKKAEQLAHSLDLKIDGDHIQDCLDTYRDWLNARSICPRCSTKSLQQSDLRYYHCFNCHQVWRVAPSRFCRAYRAKTGETPSSQLEALIKL